MRLTGSNAKFSSSNEAIASDISSSSFWFFFGNEKRTTISLGMGRIKPRSETAAEVGPIGLILSKLFHRNRIIQKAGSFSRIREFLLFRDSLRIGIHEINHGSDQISACAKQWRRDLNI